MKDLRKRIQDALNLVEQARDQFDDIKTDLRFDITQGLLGDLRETVTKGGVIPDLSLLDEISDHCQDAHNELDYWICEMEIKTIEELKKYEPNS